MTGTASELCDFDDNVNNSYNTDLLTSWLFGKINTNCLLSDITQYGCSVLIPKDQTVPSGFFNLLIMSPENSEQLHTVINSEERWIDHEYSLTHKKIGIRFLNIKEDLLLDINVLMQYLKISKHQNIKCSLLKL